MATNIELENLQSVTSGISDKFVFLYTNDPSVDPVYITIENLFKSIDTEYSLTEKLAEIDGMLQTLETNSYDIGILQASLTAVVTRLTDLETNEVTIKADIESIKTSIDELSSTVSQLSAQVTSTNTTVEGLSSDMDVAQTAITTLNEQVASLESGSTVSIDAMAWQRLE